MKQIPFVNLEGMHAPIRSKLDQAIADVIDRNDYINGRSIPEFEAKFAAMMGCRRMVGLSSGTDAIFLALKALETQPGDYVLTVPHTFIATTEAISMAGAHIRFVDVDPVTANMDPQQLEAALKSSEAWRRRLKAVVFVCLYGNPSGLAEVSRVCRQYGIPLVCDAAQAHGALINGESVASFADIVTYSFFPGKNLGAFGDAGAAACNKDEWADLISMLRNHGRTEKYLHRIEAYNCRMDTLQAAVLNVKADCLANWNLHRIRAAERYSRSLEPAGIRVPRCSPGVQPVYHLYVIETNSRDVVLEHLKNAGVACGVHYPVPLHLQPAYSGLGFRKGDFPVSESLSERVVSLPVDGVITDEEIDYVVGRVIQATKG